MKDATRKKLGRFINKFTRPFGFYVLSIHKIIPSASEKNWASQLDIQTVIDIGSNEGQFIKEINNILPNREIIAFEPIKDCYNKLIENTKHLKITAYNFAIGDSSGYSEINISNNLVSSSMLEMKELHKSFYPESEYIQKEKIEIRRLDDVIDISTIRKNILVKIDVQGFEKNVVNGGEKVISNATAIIIESSFEVLYEGQWLFHDIYTYFTAHGYRFMGFTEQFNAKSTGIPLYADSIFIRNDMVRKVL